MPSSLASAPIASAVDRAARIIARSLTTVGDDENRESTSTVTDMPGTVVSRSLNTPTTRGRRSPVSSPARGLPFSSLRPTNSAVVRSTSEKMLISVHAADSTSLRGAVATTTLRSRTSTFSAPTRTNIALSAAPSPLGGAVARSMPPPGGMLATAVHGTVALSCSGTCDMSGTSTGPVEPFCGQVTVASVTLTGRNGVATARSTPSRPATVATSRAVRYCARRSRATGGRGTAAEGAGTVVTSSGTIVDGIGRR